MPAPPLSNNLDGGTNGVAISAGNSGGLSGDAFSAITGTLCLFDNAQSHSSAFSMGITPVASVVQTVQWTGLGTITTSVWAREYLYLTALPGTNMWIMRMNTAAAGRCALIRIDTAGHVQGGNAAGSAIAASVGTSVVPLNKWFRIEWRVLPSATVGELEWRLFADADSNAITETKLVTGQVLAANVGALHIGLPETPTPTSGTFRHDDIAVSSQDWLGPSQQPMPQPTRPLLLALSKFKPLVSPVWAPSPVYPDIVTAAGPFTYEKTGALTAGTIASGADVFEASETGAITTRALPSGTDSFQPAEAGSLTAGTQIYGGDVFNANETGTTPVGTLLSGVSAYVPAGPVTYTKAGSLTAGATVSGADSFQPVEAGSLTAQTQLRGADVATYAEAGTTPVGTLLSGVSVKITSGVYAKAGSLTAGTTLSGVRVLTLNRTGALLVDTLLAGVKQYVPATVPVIPGSVVMANADGNDVTVADLVGGAVLASAATGNDVTVATTSNGETSVEALTGNDVSIVEADH